MSSEIHIAITGAGGRMGRRLVALATQLEQVHLVAALTSPGDERIGRDAGELAGVGTIGLPLLGSLDPDVKPHVLIDFSAPEGFRNWGALCHRRRIAMLVGTTPLSDADHQLIDTWAHEIAILQATNTSLGVAVLNHVAAVMTSMLGDEFDIEIIEAHHRHKRDAPSGTATTLADHVLKARRLKRDAIQHGRVGDAALRQIGSIGMHSLRLGDVVGEHTVHFGSDGERLSVSHHATSRDTFVKGALKAATWLAGRGAGRYTIEDVLGIRR
jgi:4-hydroxy-tetrahydrodipicolinate reductase